MPTFTEIKNQYTTLRGQIETLTTGIARNKDLGNGYTLRIVVKVSRAGIDVEYTLDGPDVDINNIPLITKRNYFLAVKKIEDWKNDLLADFPTL